MKVISRIAMVAVVALVVAASLQPASAICPNARLIAGCAGTCAYISTPGQNTVGAGGSIQGSFWGLGGGNPAIGPGDDNGVLRATGNPDTSEDWIKAYAGQAYFGGSWGAAGVDGCVDNATTPSPKRTVISLTDSDVPGPNAKSYWGLVCKEQDGTTFNFDFVNLGPPTLGELPYPRITGSSRVSGVSVTVSGVAAPQAHIGSNILADASCNASSLIAGYRLYTQTRSNGAGQPSPSRSEWTPEGGVLPVANPAPGFTKTCGADTSVWVATALVYNTGTGNFESENVSQAVRVPCDPSIADRPGNFKIIKKPGVQDRQQ